MTRIESPTHQTVVRYRNGDTAHVGYAYSHASAMREAIRFHGADGVIFKVLSYDGSLHQQLDRARELWNEALRYRRLAIESARSEDFEWHDLYRQESLALLRQSGKIRRAVEMAEQRTASDAFL